MNASVTQWLHDISGETTARKIGDKLDRAHSTVSRWMRIGIPLESVVKVCVEQQLDLPASLVALGVITEAESRRLPRNLSVVPTWELTAELHQRAIHQRQRRTA